MTPPCSIIILVTQCKQKLCVQVVEDVYFLFILICYWIKCHPLVICWNDCIWQVVIMHFPWPGVDSLPDSGLSVTDGSFVLWASGRVWLQRLLPVSRLAPWWAVCFSSARSPPIFLVPFTHVLQPTNRGAACRKTTAGRLGVDSSWPEEVMWPDRSGAELLSLWREADTWTGLSSGLSVTSPPHSVRALWWPWRIEGNRHGQIRSRQSIHRSLLVSCRILSALGRRCNFSVMGSVSVQEPRVL